MRQQVGQHVVAVLIPGARGRTRIAAHHDFEFRIRRVRGEVLVRINVLVGGMIDGQNTDLIEVDSFLQRLHEAEAELAVFLANGVVLNLDVLDRPRSVALPGPNPVPDHARAQHVGDELVAFAIPYKQRRAGTAAAVDLEKILLFIASDVDFILQHAGRPSHTHDVGLFRVAKADHDVGGILPQVSGRTGNLNLLPVPPREDFNFRTDGALVVGQPLEREAQPVILIAAFIAQQQHGGPVILRDQQIGGAVAIVIAGNDGARIFELNLVETNVGGNVFETIGPEIAEQADLALTFFGLADNGDIHPAVVVVVEGGDTESNLKTSLRERYCTKTLSVIVMPNR